MSVTWILLVITSIVSLLCALLAAIYVVKDLRSDFLLLGAGALVSVFWLVQTIALGVVDLGGYADQVPDRVLLYGYLLTGLVMPIGGGYVSIMERSRWGSAAILVAAVTMPILELRLLQMWPAGF